MAEDLDIEAMLEAPYQKQKEVSSRFVNFFFSSLTQLDVEYELSYVD